MADKAIRDSEWVAGRGSIGKEYWICDGCREEFETEILAEKHEKVCEGFLLKEVTARVKARRKETAVPSEVKKAKVSSVTATSFSVSREASGFIFFIGVVLLVGALLFPTEDVTEECGDQPVTSPEEIQDFRDCMESVQSQMNVVKWLGGLGVIFCFIGIFTKIR